jgi:copper chaperone CopZ
MNENCYVVPINKTALDTVIRNADNALLSISGMGCQNCARRVRNGLFLLDGVFHAEIYLNLQMAEVFFDGGRVSAEALVDAVAGAGNDSRHRYLAEVVAK